MARPAAILFDFDGIIVDSERLHHETMVAAMAGAGPATPWEFYQEHLMGVDDRGAFAVLLERAGIVPTPDEIQRRIAVKAKLFAAAAAAGRAPVLPGAVALVRACATQGPVGLCSGALRSDIRPILNALEIADCFAEMVTADDVPQSKPDPACYRLCVARLAARFPAAGITPAACVAIEDTADGIRAARGAGIPVVGVATTTAAALLQAAGARRVFAALTAINPAQLAADSRLLG